jgi:FixJ family two-component response regulator
MNLEYTCPASFTPKSSKHPFDSSSTLTRQYAGTDMTDKTAPTQVVHVLNGNPHMRQAVHDYVSSEGFNVVSFVSAAEYRAANKSVEPACLIIDADLPDLNGFDLQQPVANIDAPIVFVTTWCDVPPWLRAIKAGAIAFLTSPLRRSELLNAVHIAIAMHREVRSQRSEMAQLRQRFAKLTPREREVLGLVNSGLLNKQSALELDISETTLQIHRRHVMQKMAARSLADLVRMATKLEVPVHSWPARRIAVLAKRPDDATNPTRRHISAACP